MQRTNYDSKVIGIFDIIGSYFVDVFYNHHYLVARDAVRAGRASNITDSYRNNVLLYMDGVNNRPDLYKKLVHQWHEFYQKNSIGFGSIVLSDFQNKVLSQFIPIDYYRDFNNQHKDKIFREIIIRSVSDFGEAILQHGMLSRIIDDHMNRENVTVLQDVMVDILILQREEYHSKFARAVSRRNAGDKVDKDVLEKLKNEYVNEKKRCCELAADNERSVQMINELLKTIQTQKEEITRLTNKIAELDDGPSDEEIARARQQKLAERFATRPGVTNMVTNTVTNKVTNMVNNTASKHAANPQIEETPNQPEIKEIQSEPSENVMGLNDDPWMMDV